MPSNQTTNYQLSQWAKSDRVLMDDFNADNAKIDGALKALADRAYRLEYTMETRGTGSAFTYSYTGRGGPTVHIPFDHRPELVFLMAKDGSLPVVIATFGVAATNSPDVTFHDWPEVSGGWTGFTGAKYNEKGKEYIAVGILNCYF